MAVLALLAVMVQCLLPVSHALAMSQASQEAAYAQAICAYHQATQDVDQGQGTEPLSAGKIVVCPMCQASAMGGGLALPVQQPQTVRHDMPSGFVSHAAYETFRPLASFDDDLAAPRGPPAFF
jgi:hypothetical protein